MTVVNICTFFRNVSLFHDGVYLLAAQEQLAELTEQLGGAIREIQERQAELRRVNEQAGGLADELAQCQHQAQLEAGHAAELQSAAISSKIHLMQEAEHLTQERDAAREEAARLQASLQASTLHRVHAPCSPCHALVGASVECSCADIVLPIQESGPRSGSSQFN